MTLPAAGVGVPATKTGPVLRAKREQAAQSNADIAKIWLDENHVYRYITHEGKKGTLRSVTAALKVIDKPALMIWAARMGAEFFLQEVQPGIALSPERVDQVAEGIRYEHWKQAKKAADAGTRAHELIEMFLRGLPLPDLDNEPDEIRAGVKNAVELFLDWWLTRELTFVEAEKLVYDAEIGYAGTLDWLASRPDGQLVVLDWKTSSGIFAEMRLQVCAYVGALHRMGYPKPAEAWIIRCGKEDVSYEAQEIPPATWPEHFRGFRLALELCNFLARMKTEDDKAWRARQEARRQ